MSVNLRQARVLFYILRSVRQSILKPSPKAVDYYTKEVLARRTGRHLSVENIRRRCWQHSRGKLRAPADALYLIKNATLRLPTIRVEYGAWPFKGLRTVFTEIVAPPVNGWECMILLEWAVGQLTDRQI